MSYIYTAPPVLLYNYSMSQTEYNCSELAEKLKKVQTLYREYQSTIPENRDGDFTTIKQLDEGGELEKKLLELEEVLPCPENILEIDRNLNLVDFLTKPETEGGLGIDWLDSENPIVESDKQNEGLTEIDLSKVRLDTEWFRDELKKENEYVTGEKCLEDLKKRDVIRLDLFVFASLWKLLKGNEEQKKEFENKLTIIAEANGMKLDDLKMEFLFFDGMIIRGLYGECGPMYLHWFNLEWGWKSPSNSLDRSDDSPSLVLVS